MAHILNRGSRAELEGLLGEGGFSDVTVERDDQRVFSVGVKRARPSTS